MDYSKYLGLWVNTYQQGHTISQFRLYEKDGQLMIETETTFKPNNWGSTRAFPFGYASAPDKFAAFEAHYALETTDSRLQVYENKGLLIVAGFHHTKPVSGKQAFFTREFFLKA